jgi:hypothetical protein
MYSDHLSCSGLASLHGTLNVTLLSFDSFSQAANLQVFSTTKCGRQTPPVI